MKTKYIKPVTEKLICQCQNSLLAGSPTRRILDSDPDGDDAKRGEWTYDERVGDDVDWGTKWTSSSKKVWE